MLGDVVRRLIADLDNHVAETSLGDPFLSGHSYRAHALDAVNFKQIRTTESRSRLAFVDGGNQELLGAPNFSVQLNRVYFNIFEGRRLVSPKSIPNRIEFFSVTSAKFRNGEIHYDTTLFPSSEDFADFLPSPSDLSISSTDSTIMTGKARADISRVGSNCEGSLNGRVHFGSLRRNWGMMMSLSWMEFFGRHLRMNPSTLRQRIGLLGKGE